MARLYGEGDDAFISEEIESGVTRNTDDYEVSGDAAHDGYTVMNRRPRMNTAGDWPDNLDEAKRIEDLANSPFGSFLFPWNH